MYYDFTIEIPKDTGKIVRLKNRNGSVYINYEYDRVYDKKRKYTQPKRTTIGRQSENDENKMYPNRRFYEFFPQIEMPKIVDNEPKRARFVKVGTFLVIRKIIQDYKLDQILQELIGDKSGLFLDLAAYTIITEDNAAQYYPAYTYEHPLLTENMYPYSDSTVSDFLKNLSRDASETFMDRWNASKDHREKIYISYDSTNKDCSAGAIDIAEEGHPKDKSGKPVFNYSIGYNLTSREPVFYEDYPGSINDVSELTIMAQKVLSYHYKRVGFIIDRGYFSEPNIHFLRANGYSFIIMMKGMRALVSDTVRKVKGTFEKKRENYISPFGDTGKTVARKLYPSDTEDSYLHVYYNPAKSAAETHAINKRIDRLKEWLDKQIGKAEGSFTVKDNIEKYFDLIWSVPEKESDSQKGKTKKSKEPRRLVSYAEKYDVIDEELDLTGYFALVSSEKLTAAEALKLYKSRDASEKLFRGDKAYLGDATMRVYEEDSVESKIFIEFVALIIRNKIYTSLLDAKTASTEKENYMDVPAAIAELEKINMIRSSGNDELGDGYYLGHALTKTQKTILKAFDMDAVYMERVIKGLGNELKESDKVLKKEKDENDDDEND